MSAAGGPATPRAARARWRRAALYVALTLALGGCVPVGARWQNMFSALGLLG